MFALERRFDFQSLFRISIAENIDQRLLIGSETFHRFAQRIGIAVRVEVRGGDHRSLLLNDAPNREIQAFPVTYDLFFFVNLRLFVTR